MKFKRRGPLFITGVDVLIELVHSKKEISLNEAAKELGVSEVVAEDWVIHNQLAGGILSIKRKSSKKYVTIKATKIIE